MVFVLPPLRQDGSGRRNRNLCFLLIFSLLAFPLAVSADERGAEGERLLDQSVTQIDEGDYAAAVRSAEAAAKLYAALGDARNRTVALNQAGLAQTYAGLYPAARASLD